MNHYETVSILAPALSDAQVKEAVDKFTSHLTPAGAAIVNDGHWRLKKLAYPIERKPTGFYHFTEFDAEPSAIKPFETLMKRDETVLRYVTIAQDKLYHAYAGKRHALKSSPVAEK